MEIETLTKSQPGFFGDKILERSAVKNNKLNSALLFTQYRLSLLG